MFIVIEKIFKEKHWLQSVSVTRFNKSFFGHTFWMLFTFVIVCFAWIFFRANTFTDSLTIVSKSFHWKAITKKTIFSLGLEAPEFIAAIIFIILLLMFEAIHNKFGALRVLNKQFIVLRWGFYIVAIFTLIIFGIYGDTAPKEFIYFQF